MRRPWDPCPQLVEELACGEGRWEASLGLSWSPGGPMFTIRIRLYFEQLNRLRKLPVWSRSLFCTSRPPRVLPDYIIWYDSGFCSHLIKRQSKNYWPAFLRFPHFETWQMRSSWAHRSWPCPQDESPVKKRLVGDEIKYCQLSNTLSLNNKDLDDGAKLLEMCANVLICAALNRKCQV